MSITLQTTIVTTAPAVQPLACDSAYAHRMTIDGSKGPNGTQGMEIMLRPFKSGVAPQLADKSATIRLAASDVSALAASVPEVAAFVAAKDAMTAKLATMQQARSADHAAGQIAMTTAREAVIAARNGKQPAAAVHAAEEAFTAARKHAGQTRVALNDLSKPAAVKA